MAFLFLLLGLAIYGLMKAWGMSEEDNIRRMQCEERNKAYQAAYQEALETVQNSPFLDVAFDCLCRNIDLNLHAHTTSICVYYPGIDSFHVQKDSDYYLDGNTFSKYSSLGYDEIVSPAKRDAVVHYLVPRLQKAYPYLNIQNRELSYGASKYQSIAVDYSRAYPTVILKKI